MQLFGKNGRQDSLTFENVRVVDPTRGLDEALTVRVEEGIIAALEPASRRPTGRCWHRPSTPTSTCALRAARTKRIVSGTRAAAAGATAPSLPCRTRTRRRLGFRPGALAEQAEREAELPVGFLAAISKGQDGAELTEMVELAERAPSACGRRQADRRPGLLRRALQYSAAAGPPVAVHCEEPTLSRGGHVHEGLVSAELGFGALPIGGREHHGRPRPGARRLRAAPAPPPSSLRARIGRRASPGPPGGCAGDGRGHPAPPLPHRRGRALDPNVKMNPPLRGHADRAALVDALVDGTIEAIATDHAPTPARRKRFPSRRRRSGSPAWRPRLRRSTRSSSSRASFRLQRSWSA